MQTSPVQDADTAAALAKIHLCVRNIRQSVVKSAAAFEEFQKTQRKGEIKETRLISEHVNQDVLATAVSAILAHDSIIRKVSASRENVSADQEALLRARLELNTLTHEKDILQMKIESSRAVKSELLSKVDLALPSISTESDQAAEDAHARIMTALNEELAKRKEMRKQVEAAIGKTKEKRRGLAIAKTELRELPKAIRSLSPALQPARKLVSGDVLGDGVVEEIAKVRQLPGPLYVLSRTALAYREISGGIEVRVLGTPVEDASRFQEERRSNHYIVHPMQVAIEILGRDNEPSLRIIFRYHVNLGIISVTSAVVVEGLETPSFPTRELQMLYPSDFGEQPPNPCFEHKENSTDFNALKSGGRPFVWANMICGIPCLPRVNLPESNVMGSFANWAAVAAQHPEHLRFKDVINTLQERLQTIVSLKRLVEVLLSRQLPVSATSIGIPKEPTAVVTEFVKLSSQGQGEDESLGRLGTKGKYTEIWGMTVCRGELRIDCKVGLEPDYPVGPPVFRLRCAKGIPNLFEKDMVELEQCVNEYQMRGDAAARQDLLLGAQITALLTYIDNLVSVCESIDEGTVESGSIEVKGRTRSKKDAILGHTTYQSLL